MKYDVFIIFAYVFGGIIRGTTVNVLSTEIIRMYSLFASSFDFSNKIIVSILSTTILVGSMCATLIFTYLNIWFGRRTTLKIAACICVIANVLSCIPIHWIYLACIRLFAGLGSSIIMTTMPMLFSEFIAPQLRGLFSSLMNYFIGTGAFLSSLVQLYLMDHNGFFYFAFFPSIICSITMFILCFFIKETNSSIASFNKTDEKNERIFQKKYWKCIVNALALGASNPGTGINPILNFSTLMLKDSLNVKYPTAVGSIIMFTIVIFSSSITLPLIKRFNRKNLILIGVIGMSIGHLMFIVIKSITVDNTTTKLFITLAASFIFILPFQLSYGPLCFAIAAEVFPLLVKTKFMNVTMITFWIVLIFVTFTYPIFVGWVDHSIYLVFVLVTGIVLMIYLPETRNKTLDEIERAMVGAEQSRKATEMKVQGDSLV